MGKQQQRRRRNFAFLNAFRVPYGHFMLCVRGTAERTEYER